MCFMHSQPSEKTKVDRNSQILANRMKSLVSGGEKRRLDLPIL